MSACDVPVEAVDLSILDRITQSDIEAWMLAKLKSLRLQTKLPACTLQLTASLADWSRPPYFYPSWNMHAASACAYDERLEKVVEKVTQELLGDPAGKARDKRDKARRLLKEAEKLEKLAVGGLPA